MRSGLYLDPWTEKNLPAKIKFRQKLMHLAADALSAPLTFAINSGLQTIGFQIEERMQQLPFGQE